MDGGASEMVAVRAHRGRPFSYVVLRRGVESTGASPPEFASVVAATGPAGRALRAFHLRPSVPRPVSGWSATGGRTALDGGPRRWGGRTGRLFLVPPTRDQLGNLVAFSWLDGSQRRMVAVGAWSPAADAVATLRAIVASLPRRRAGGDGVASTAPIAGTAMVRTPGWVMRLCRDEVRTGCPTRLPRPASPTSLVQVTPVGHGRRAGASVDVAWGGTTGRASADRPPQLVHLIVSDADRPPSGAPAAGVNPVTLLRGGYPRKPVVLGHPGWTRPAGTLSLGDCFGDHVCYRWRSAGRNHLVSIHAWSPLTQTLSVFAQVVRSIR